MEDEMYTPDWDLITKNFLNKADFHQWHLWAMNHTLIEACEDTDILEQCDWLAGCRIELSRGVDQIIEYHLDNESYEMIPKLQAHVKLLRAEALEIEMAVESLWNEED